VNLKGCFNEQWLMRRLREQGAGMLDAGVTTAEQRIQNVRAAIEKHGPMVIAGKGKSGKPMTYAEAFEAVYGQPFAQPQASAA
jgi:hypothetical protein